MGPGAVIGPRGGVIGPRGGDVRPRGGVDPHPESGPTTFVHVCPHTGARGPRAGASPPAQKGPSVEYTPPSCPRGQTHGPPWTRARRLLGRTANDWTRTPLFADSTQNLDPDFGPTTHVHVCPHIEADGPLFAGRKDKSREPQFGNPTHSAPHGPQRLSVCF